MPGPPKTPREFKVVSGTLRADDAMPDAPQFPVVREFPAPPQQLNPDGVAIWNDLGRQLTACGVIQVVDLYALEQLAYSWQVFRQKSKAGMEVTASEHNALKGLLIEFGLTPAARRRVVANITEAQPTNRFSGHGKKQG
jgi:phage terminase small subunit